MASTVIPLLVSQAFNLVKRPSETTTFGAIEKILDLEDYTALRSGHKAPESPLKWFKMGDKNQFISINLIEID